MSTADDVLLVGLVGRPRRAASPGGLAGRLLSGAAAQVARGAAHLAAWGTSGTVAILREKPFKSDATGNHVFVGPVRRQPPSSHPAADAPP